LVISHRDGTAMNNPSERMPPPRGEKIEPPDHNFNLHLVAIEFANDTEMQAQMTKLLFFEDVKRICRNLNEELIYIGFYAGYIGDGEP
jgi:hypothetical protein